MILVAQQPNYFPWLGYLEQIARADHIVLLDDVQWLRCGWQRRARIALHPGQTEAARGPKLESPSNYQWLTVPLKNSSRDQQLADLRVSSEGAWPLRHWKTIQSVYGRRPYFKQQIEPLFKPWFQNIGRRLDAGEKINLAPLLRENILLCLSVLNMGHKAPSFVFSSQLRSIDVPHISADATKTQRLLRLCLALKAQTYYSGIASTSYIDLSAFRSAGIGVLWQRWRHPVYDQGANAFVTHLSFLDALANMPLEQICESLKPLPWGPFASSHNQHQKNFLPG